MKKTLVLSLLFAALSAHAALAAAPVAGDAAPAINEHDVKGHAVTVPDTGKVMVLSFASKSTGEKAGDVTREIRVAHPDVVILSFIDLSGFPGFMRGIVKGKVSARQDDAVKEGKDAFKKAGKEAPADLDQRIHLVPDWDAGNCKKYGATDTGNQAVIAVIGADGKVKAIFDKTPSLADVQAAVEKELGAK